MIEAQLHVTQKRSYDEPIDSLETDFEAARQEHGTGEGHQRGSGASIHTAPVSVMRHCKREKADQARHGYLSREKAPRARPSLC